MTIIFDNPTMIPSMYDITVPFHQIADHNLNINVRMFVNYLDVICVAAILMVFPLFPMLNTTSDSTYSTIK